MMNNYPLHLVKTIVGKGGIVLKKQQKRLPNPNIGVLLKIMIKTEKSQKYSTT